MNGALLTKLLNVAAVARREFVCRAGTRSFRISTLLLVLAGALTGLAPVAISALSRDSTRVAVYTGAADLRVDPVATLEALLDPATDEGAGAQAGPAGGVAVARSEDLEADRERVRGGSLNALMDVERAAAGDLVFTVYTRDPGDGRTALLSRQAATSIAVADRLGRAGIAPSDQAALFAAPEVIVRSPDRSGPAVTSQSIAQRTTDIAVIFAVEVFLLLAIIMYGTWVAQSVVEEKSSRMMEIILAAASPFELLAGKVLGVSAAAMLQFVAAVSASIVALLVEGQVASAVLGGSGVAGLPIGLTVPAIVTFATFFVLGFVLYAALFAAAGSLVSRQEDVNQVVMPMSLLACAGYMIALYTSIGSLDASSPLVAALSWVPLLTPYTIVAKVSAGGAAPAEVVAAVVLVLVTIVVAAWVASRVYAAGVLLSGQRPGMRRMWAAVRRGW